VAARLFGVDLLDEAAAELEHEAGYYLACGGPAIRDAFLDEFARVAQRIADNPRSFPAWPGKPSVRRAVLKRYPFTIGFVAGTSNDEPPLIVVIAHAKRRPGYWLRRAPAGRSRRRPTP
jgi:plasmid stabilization system protein ParE